MAASVFLENVILKTAFRFIKIFMIRSVRFIIFFQHTHCFTQIKNHLFQFFHTVHMGKNGLAVHRQIALYRYRHISSLFHGIFFICNAQRPIAFRLF